MTKLFDLSGRTAIVTGASGAIGGMIATTLHALGAQVLLSGTNEANLKLLSDKLKHNVATVTCNLHDLEATENLIEQATTLFGKIDILVCNAGMTKDNIGIKMSNEEFANVINVNLIANFVLNKAAIKKMLKYRYGRIINIASIIGTTGNPGQANYAASKAGLIAMSKSLAAEVASRGITINTISPGFIATAMTDALKDEQKEHMLARIPMKSFGLPEDVAAAAAYLSSEQARYVTGQTIHVNGGMLMV
jgi:3-oxoacyl-[acyl-carrier protein] reductase